MSTGSVHEWGIGRSWPGKGFDGGVSVSAYSRSRQGISMAEESYAYIPIPG